MRRKEISEEMEIQKELETDDISPIQSRVDKVFDDSESGTVEALDNTEVIHSILEEYTEDDCIPRNNYTALTAALLKELE